MNGDLSRVTYDQLKHYTRVVMQQGRVQVDADWNEQIAILLHYLQRLAEDLIGPHGGPADLVDQQGAVLSKNYGFEIKCNTTKDNFQIGVGRYYIDGRLCEKDVTDDAIATAKLAAQAVADAAQTAALTAGATKDSVADAASAKAADPAFIKQVTKDAAQAVANAARDAASISGATPQDVSQAAANAVDQAWKDAVNKGDLYSRQPDLPLLDDKNLPQDESNRFAGLLKNHPLLVYLDVWERHITPIEDPAVREVALGGADTAARAKLLCQVKVESRLRGGSIPSDITCQTINTYWDAFVGKWQPTNRGVLRSKARESDKGADPTEPCITSPEARYRRGENQLYRIEIHDGGAAANATFKWSRDNGALVAPVLKMQGNDLNVGGFRDISRWFTAGQWVEMTYDAIDLLGRPGTMFRLMKVDGEMLTIDPATIYGTIFNPAETINDAAGISHPKFKHLKIRAWNHKEIGETPLHNGAVRITEDEWMELEDGVQIQFVKSTSTAHTYRTGDYWLIPARVATGDVEWPIEKVPDPKDPQKMIDQPKALPPHGVEHHYAPLAIILLVGENQLDQSVKDLRHKIDASGKCQMVPQ